MNFLQLKYFQSVAENEHLIKTAERLMVTPSAISASLSNLEDELGVKLFDRIGRNIRLNEYGRIVQKYTDIILQAQQNALSELKEQKMHTEQSVTFGVTSVNFWQNSIIDFIENHPDIHVIQRDVEAEMHKIELKQLNVDFLLTALPLPKNEWESQILMNDPIIVVVPNFHRLANRKEINLIELKDEKFIGCNFDISFRLVVDAVCQAAGFQPQYICEGNVLVMPSLASRGIGLCITTMQAYVSGLYKNTSLLKILDLPGDRAMNIAWRKTHKLSKAAILFREYMVKYYSAENLRKMWGDIF